MEELFREKLLTAVQKMIMKVRSVKDIHKLKPSGEKNFRTLLYKKYKY
jgi:hypothetical protein